MNEEERLGPLWSQIEDHAAEYHRAKDVIYPELKRLIQRAYEMGAPPRLLSKSTGLSASRISQIVHPKPTKAAAPKRRKRSSG